MGRSASMPAIKVSLAPPQLSQVPPLDIIRLTPKSILQTQVSRPTMTRACSSSITMPVPTSIPLKQVPRPTMIRACPSASLAHVRSHLSGMLLSKDGIRPSSVPPSSAPQQLLSDVVRSSRAHNIHRASSPTMFKRVGPVRGPLQRSRSAYGSSNNSNCVNPSQYVSVNHSGCANPSQYGRIPAPMAASNDGIPFSWQDNHSSLHQIPSLPMGSSIVGSAVPSQPQIYSQPIPQSAYVHQEGNQSQNDSQNIYQYGIQSQNASQNVCLQGIGPSAVDLGFSDCNYSWMNNSSQSTQQLPIEISQVQSTESIYGPSPVKEPDFQSNGFPNLKGLESDFDSWLLDNEPVTNDSVPSQLDLLSPGPPLADAGMLLFDFETSFNSLTQV